MRIADYRHIVNVKVGAVLFLCAAASPFAAAAAAEMAAQIVQAPDAPARLERARILTTGDAPPVLLYAATNPGDAQIDTLTVMVFIFRDGMLKARQVAPARRTLDPHETKYSALVIDGFDLQPNDAVVVGINQVQRAGSEQWWRADLQAAAEAAVAKRLR